MIRARCLASPGALTAALEGLLRRELSAPGQAPRAVMLAGGSTPLAAYGRLAADPPAAPPCQHILWCDDRHVPPDSPQSNYGHARPLLQALGIPAGRILRVWGELDLPAATRRYDEDLNAFLSKGGRITAGVLGLGADGHTASLFTPADVGNTSGTWAISVRRPDGLYGVSATRALLHRVERLVFVTAGADKRPMAEALLKRPTSIAAGLAVDGHPSVEIWTDPLAWPFPK